MMRLMIKIWVFLLWAVSLQAQTSTGGLLTSDERYERIPLLPTYSGAKYTEIPVRVSLKKYCPVPGDQGKNSACVGWAVGYGALTIQRAIQRQETDQALITQQANSAAFLYNQVRKNQQDCAEGAYLEDGLVLVKERGDCLEQSFNYERYDCTVQPEAKHRAEATRYRIQDFAAVFELNEDPKSKIGKTCKILATQTPLIVGIGVTKTFFEVLPGADTWNPESSEPISGYHAMVVVGYNSVDKYVELLNSFGTSWGKNGFIRLSFEDYERLCRYAYVMIPGIGIPEDEKKGAEHPPQNVQNLPTTVVLSGAFVFRQPAGFVSNNEGEELMYFEEISTRRDTAYLGLYHTVQRGFKAGDVFQLVARDIPRGRYVYVFSQGPDGHLKLHFPRKKEAVTSAGFVLEKTVELVIPSEESLLQLPAAGEDHLCILYSQASINALEQRLAQIESMSAPFAEKVQTAFADVLIQAPDVQFSHEKMSFSALAKPETGKIAAAIILSVLAF